MTLVGRLAGKIALVGAALLALSCARPGRPPPATPTAEGEARPARIPDSVPERVAAQRAASGTQLQLEAEDERWGIEAAQERKRLEEQRKQASPTPTPAGSGSMGIAPPANAPKPPAAPPRP